MKTRAVKKIVNGYPTLEGAGVKIIRVLGPDDITDIDPFLMLDAFGSDNPEDYIKGFPMHPHRGIETITYLFEGVIEHRDSLGNDDAIRSGELQWMTSGSGIMHEEMPQPTPYMQGLQFWLNMPAKDKMVPPAYFPIYPDMIKTFDIEEGRVKLISGSYNGVQGITPPNVQASMLDIEIKPNMSFTIPVSAEENTFVYILKGKANFGEEKTSGEMYDAVIFAEGDQIALEAGAEGIHFILLSGKPLNEPVAWGGPVVMNTRAELQQAFAELHQGTFIK